MKRLTLAEARQQIEDRELWLWRQANWGQGWDVTGANAVSDRDEDYVVDALFDIANR